MKKKIEKRKKNYKYRISYPSNRVSNHPIAQIPIKPKPKIIPIGLKLSGLENIA